MKPISSPSFAKSKLLVLECNIDDMNPEWYPYATERLFEQGAKDVWLTPIVMKGGRPGQILSVLCSEETKTTLLETCFRETTTLGIRAYGVERYEVRREESVVESEYGSIIVKISRSSTGEILNASPEYADCMRVAQELGLSLKEVYRAATLAAAKHYQTEKTKNKC